MDLHANAPLASQTETHQFRLGLESRESTPFTADAATFPTALAAALEHHRQAQRRGDRLFLQVLTDADWRLVQNPNNGRVIIITPELATQPDHTAPIFHWASHSVQMVHKAM